MRNVQQYWECPMCGHVNEDVFCRECGSLRPGVVKVPQAVPSTQVSDNSAPAQDDGKWRCHICGHDNTESFCSVCGQSKENNAKMIVPDQSAFPSFPSMNQNMQPARGMMCDMPFTVPSDPKINEPWVCPNCEHTNKGGEYCFNCGVPNPVLQKDKDWICPDCGASMPARSTFCHECGKLKPGISKREATAAAVQNDSDPWKCIKCGSENSGGLFCEKCDAAKPPENAVFSGALGLGQQNDIKVSMQPAFGGADLPDFINSEQMRRYSNKFLKDKPVTCGCYTCCKIFVSSEITNWNGNLAVCPYCGRETIVGKPINEDLTPEFLDKMNRFHIKNERVDGFRRSRCTDNIDE